MFYLMLLSFTDIASSTLQTDTVVTPQVQLNWTSQTFIIPRGSFPKDTSSFRLTALRIALHLCMNDRIQCFCRKVKAGQSCEKNDFFISSSDYNGT